MSETALATKILPIINGYTGLSNPDRKSYSHGGRVAYGKNECYTSFRLDFGDPLTEVIHSKLKVQLHIPR